jgi:hypothetical protein
LQARLPDRFRLENGMVSLGTWFRCVGLHGDEGRFRGKGCHPVLWDSDDRGDPLTRRFDIGPILLALGALLLLVGLFLDWYGPLTAWNAFEVTDVLLAGLAVAGLIAAVGLVAPDLEYVERRHVPWIVGATFVLVAFELLDPPPAATGSDLKSGAWLALGAAVVMVLGAVLTFSRVKFSVELGDRDRRVRVSAVDHQGPPTETGTVVEPSDSSLFARPSGEAEPEA